MSDMPAAKPPAQGVGVEGFNAFAAKPETQAPVIDWSHVCGLPAFEMFMAERHPHGEPTTRALFDEYCQWHANKGCWPNETPLGELVEPSP